MKAETGAEPAPTHADNLQIFCLPSHTFEHARPAHCIVAATGTFVASTESAVTLGESQLGRALRQCSSVWRTLRLRRRPVLS